MRQFIAVHVTIDGLEVDGVVQYSEEERLWVAVIDWDAIREDTLVVSQAEQQLRDVAT